MCTALTFSAGDHYFGRNLDLEFSYHESVVITPRNYPFSFCKAPALPRHYALIGAAIVQNDYPLYYDAANEYGLSMAGLNFPGNAVYFPENPAKTNITPFEFIPWVLSRCKNLTEARSLLADINLLNIPFSPQYPLSPLHWLIADQTAAITVESTSDGLHIHENPVGVLTNNPPFDFHMQNLSHYLTLSPKDPQNRLAPNTALPIWSRGMGAIGLPGDLSSASRFVRAVFTKSHSVCAPEETAAVNQFFHILASVAMAEGTVKVGSADDKTVYSSCINMDKGLYYYTTYQNSRPSCVSLRKENLDDHRLMIYPFLTEPDFLCQN